MTVEYFPLTPDFVWQETYAFKTIITRFEDGYSQSRPVWGKPRRKWRLAWQNVDSDTIEQLKGFIRIQKGAATPFYYYDTADPLPSPFLGPTTDQTAGGSLGLRTLYVRFTWAFDDLETTESTNYASQIVSPNNLLTVTIPEFPGGVNKAWIYVGTSSTDVKKQASAIEVSAGIWIEPETGYDTGGASPPTANGLFDRALVFLADDSFVVDKIFAGVYNAECVFEELFEGEHSAIFWATGEATLAAVTASGVCDTGRQTSIAEATIAVIAASGVAFRSSASSGAATLGAIEASGTCTLMSGIPEADYYVSATTGDDDNPGTYAEPFATIQHAINTAGTGDTIYVLAGTYAEEVDITKAYITLLGETGAKIIDATESYGVRSASVNGFTVDNFEIANQTYRGVYLYNCDDVTIKNCTIHDLPDKGVYVTGCDSVTVEYNNIYMIGDAQEAMGVQIRLSTNCVVEHNDIYMCKKNGIRASNSSSGTTIRYNVIQACWAPMDLNATAGDNLVEHNYLVDGYWGFAAKHNAGSSGHEDIFRRNTVENCCGGGYAIGWSGDPATYVDTTYNLWKGNGWLQILVAETNISNCEIDYNMYWTVSGNPDHYYNDDYNGDNHTYNSVAAIVANTAWEDHGAEYDPETVDNYGCNMGLVPTPVTSYDILPLTFISASSSASSGPNTVDWNIDTRWTATSSTNQWLVYDLGSSKTWQAFAFTMWIWDASNRPKNVKVYTGSTATGPWTERWSGINNYYGHIFYGKLSSPVTSRYVRFWITDTYGANPQIEDFQVAALT